MEEESRGIKIFHFADTHLGFSAYRKLDHDGVNQREKDVYNAFTTIVDYIIKSKPDLVIHAGDLFDSVRPTNRAISVALEQLLRLSKARIPTIVLSGNHETPKLRETGHIFQLFDHLEYIYPVYSDKEETHYFDVNGKTVVVHAIPHCREQKNFLNALRRVAPDNSADYNILTTHGAVQSVQEFRMNEFNEYLIPLSTLLKGFDYVALGHYHKHVVIRENIVYSGSVEKLSFLEAGDQKGAAEVSFTPLYSISFLPFPTRTMVDLEPINCGSLSLDEIIERIKKISAETESKDAIVRLSLLNIDTATYRTLDISFIKSLFSQSFHFEMRHTTTGELDDTAASPVTAIGDLLTEFEKFMEKSSCKNKAVILALGKRYIQQAQTEQEET